MSGIEAVLQEFGLTIDGAVQLIAAGTLNENYRVETDAGVRFVRHHRPSLSREHIEQEHRLVSWAVQRGVPAVLPLPSQGCGSVVEHDGHCWAVYPWVDGTPPQRGNMTERQVHAAGSAQGHIHRVLLDFPETVEDRQPRPFDVRRSLSELDHIISIASEANAADWILAGLSFQREQLVANGRDIGELGLARSPSHGDFHDQQLLFEADDLVAVTDWELFGLRPRVWEVVRSLAFSQILEGPHMQAYVAGYSEHMPLPEEECRLAIELWWQGRIHSVWAFQAYFLEGNERVAEFFPESFRSLRALCDAEYRNGLTDRFVRAAARRRSPMATTGRQLEARS